MLLGSMCAKCIAKNKKLWVVERQCFLQQNLLRCGGVVRCRQVEARRREGITRPCWNMPEASLDHDR